MVLTNEFTFKICEQLRKLGLCIVHFYENKEVLCSMGKPTAHIIILTSSKIYVFDYEKKNNK